MVHSGNFPKEVVSSFLLFACMNFIIGCAGTTPATLFGQNAVTPTIVYTNPGITIDSTTKYQTIDGFGISEAFGEANFLRSLPSALQQQVLDDLFSTSTGAGLDILRNMIASSSDFSIEPTNPGFEKVPPTYVWNGDDQGQVWLSKLVKKNYGITQLYANAWSAPGFMKTSGSDIGGQLCGSPESAWCNSGDWRQPYANYLVQYLQDYQREGLTIPYVGFSNEPDIPLVNYSSMLMSPEQADDFARVLGPTLKGAGLPTTIVCCDSETWLTAKNGYVPAIANDPIASPYVSVYSGHAYISTPKSPLTPNPAKRSWETEWCTFNPWDSAWDNSKTDSGFTWAQHIYTSLTAGNVNAFFYWWGASNDSKDQSLIYVNGSSINVSKRLWAFANYSRFIRPGATRISAATSNSNLEVTAFTNTNGSISIVVLNTATQAVTVPIALPKMGIADGTSVIPYVTDNTNSMTKQDPLTLTNGTFPAILPAHSLITYTISAS
jgi:glucuronoarabinoxylan endo-1,4-beta-xylanase